MAHIDETAFAVIEPGKNLTATHNSMWIILPLSGFCIFNGIFPLCIYIVASIYDFASAGTGKFTFKPNVHFLLASELSSENKAVGEANLFAHFVAASSSSVDVHINGEIFDHQTNSLMTRAFNNCTDPARKNIIDLG